MKKLGSALAALSVLMLGLTACSTSTSTTPESTAEKTESTTTTAESGTTEVSTEEVPMGDGTQTVYLVSKGFQHRFWQAVKEGAEQAGEEYNYKIEFVGPQSETQVTEQLNMLKTALDSKPAAIGLAALDTAAELDVIQQIDDAGIPIIAFDSGVDSDIPKTTVATDNYAASQEAAKQMVELIGGEGTVGVVCHDATSQTGQQRCQGFKDYMAENAPNVTVLDEQIAGEVGLAANTTKSLIQANPDIVGIYGSNEAAAGGVVQGVAESGKDVVVVGFDSGKTQLEAIRSGTEAGAVTQAPVKIGYETVVAAIRAINGQELPETIDSGYQWYDQTNIDDPEIAANLYE